MATYNYIESTGTVIPDTAEVLEETQNEFKDIFGQDFIVDPETPGGRFVDAEGTSRESVANNNAAIVNQINPNYAGGVFLDALWALLGGERDEAERSTVSVEVTGVAGTSIPPGSLASTTSGDNFQSVNNIILDSLGLGSGSFESVEEGPIPAAAGTLTQIIDSVLGWETIENNDAAVLGKKTQKDPDVRNKRRETLALQAQYTTLAISSGISNVPGVKSLSFLENKESTQEIINGITLKPNSIWVSVDGGSDIDVATALYFEKGPGCNYTGDLSVPISDPISGQPSNVLINRPDAVSILVRVTVQASSAEFNDPSTAIPEAILSYVNGELPGERGLTVGTDVSPFELSGAISRRNPEFFVPLLEIAYVDVVPVYVTTSLEIKIDEIASIPEANIQVLTV